MPTFSTVTIEQDAQSPRAPVCFSTVRSSSTPSIMRCPVKPVRRSNANDEVHVIVVKGAGKGFCGGYDLVDFPQMNVNPRNLKVSGLPNPRRFRRSAAKRPNSSRRVFSP